MAIKYLDYNGLLYFWGKLKSYISSVVPTKVSDLTNDSGFIASETDPVFSASPAAGITSANINNWNNANGIAWNSTSKELRVSKSGVVTTVLSRTDLDIPTVPTNVSSFTNDAGYLTSHQNIKTINSTSMIGTGDVSVQPTLVSGTNIKTINGTSVLGSGDITISAGGTPTAYTVVLTVAGWSNNSQTVTATGVTSSNSIIVTPAPTSIDNYANANVICTTQGTNSLTFTCENVPDESITVNILIFDGDYSAYYVGSSIPSSSLGSNGDIYLRS